MKSIESIISKIQNSFLVMVPEISSTLIHWTYTIVIDNKQMKYHQYQYRIGTLTLDDVLLLQKLSHLYLMTLMVVLRRNVGIWSKNIVPRCSSLWYLSSSYTTTFIFIHSFNNPGRSLVLPNFWYRYIWLSTSEYYMIGLNLPFCFGCQLFVGILVTFLRS